MASSTKSSSGLAIAYTSGSAIMQLNKHLQFNHSEMELIMDMAVGCWLGNIQQIARLQSSEETVSSCCSVRRVVAIACTRAHDDIIFEDDIIIFEVDIIFEDDIIILKMTSSFLKMTSLCVRS